MKITGNDYDRLDSAINKVIKDNPNIHQHYKDNGLSDTRFRWDVFFVIDYSVRIRMIDTYNDSHIDTALKKITKTA